MPTRTVNLTDEQDEPVLRIVKAGKCQNASKTMRDAMRGSQQRREEDALKLKALRKLVREGAAALRRGEFDEVDDPGLDVYLDRLAVPVQR
jgi:antitoxin ParD1/3/4